MKSTFARVVVGVSILLVIGAIAAVFSQRPRLQEPQVHEETASSSIQHGVIPGTNINPDDFPGFERNVRETVEKLRSGELVLKSITWPILDAKGEALIKRLSPLTLQNIDKLRVPVLVPDLLGLSNKETIVLAGLGPFLYSISTRVGKDGIDIGSFAPLKNPSEPIPTVQQHTVPSSSGIDRSHAQVYFDDEFGAWKVAWLENGEIPYAGTIACGSYDNPDCDEEAVRKILDSLTFVGGIPAQY